MSNQGHWKGLKADTKNFFGFIYLITDEDTQRKYIGKKQFYFTRPRAKCCRSKIADRQSPKWKASCWKDSDWRIYKGSSPSLAKWMKEYPDHNFSYEIIKLCRSRGILTYAEVAEMWSRRVLEVKLPNGEYEYFNRHIGAIKFRPKTFHSEETKAKMSAGHPKAMLGKHHSEETKKKMSEVRLGVPKTEAWKVTNSSKDVYHFINIETGGEFKGTARELYTACKLDSSSVSKVVKGIHHQVGGWRLYDNPPPKETTSGKRDYSIYSFIKGSEEFTGTRSAFMEAYPDIKGSNLRHLIKKEQLTCKGWKLK